MDSIVSQIMTQEDALSLFMKLRDGKTCAKFTCVEVRYPRNDELGTTLTTIDGGGIETSNTIDESVFIVRKPAPHQDTSWLIKRETFRNTYNQQPISNSWSMSESKGEPRFYMILTEEIIDRYFPKKVFMASWGHPTLVEIGGALVGTNDEVWSVAKNSFETTYKY